MKTANIRSRGQVYSVGNYLMTGKVLGKGHFARVEEATHRSIGKKVAIKVIDLTCIKEEYARRNLHREPRVMARLRHPCIAALYETMMHGPRLYVVMEAAGGGDLCAHVLAARGPARGLPEARARALAAQLVSAVRHMHVRGVVHRDLKMENIMLDSTKQFIKIVDFGLSNLWSAGGSLRTPCGSLEYAAPELFVDGRRYGPEVDLWSIGVIVYGMVTGGLPFTGAEGSEGRSRPQLRAAIARGFSRKQRAALAYVSAECKLFVQQLLEPNVESRMKIEEAARHRWLRRAGMRMRVHPFGAIEPKVNREIYKQISELSGSPVMDVVAQIKADPFGATAGMYNIKCHLHQLQSLPAAELLWCSGAPEPRAASPPEYRAHTAPPPSAPTAIGAKPATAPPLQPALHSQKMFFNSAMQRVHQQNEMARAKAAEGTRRAESKEPPPRTPGRPSDPLRQLRDEVERSRAPPSPRHAARPLASSYAVKKPIYKIYDNGDCGLDPRLPSIDEHSNTDLKDTKNPRRPRAPPRRPEREDERRLAAHPNRFGDGKRADFFRRAGDCLQNWRTGGVIATPPAKILLQSNATTIKRASLGNIVSPHSSSNSHCKSERAMPVGWYSTRSQLSKESSHLQRFRRTAPMK